MPGKKVKASRGGERAEVFRAETERLARTSSVEAFLVELGEILDGIVPGGVGDTLVQICERAQDSETSAGVLHDLKQPAQTLAIALERLSDAVEPMRVAAQTEQWDLLASHVPKILEAFELAQPSGEAIVDLLHEAELSWRPRIADTPIAYLPEVIEKASADARRRARSSSMVTVQQIPRVYAVTTPGKLSRIVRNLLDNALEAIVGARAPRITVSAWRSDDDVFVQVEDTGCGIAAGEERRILEPLYTTKVHGDGMGLPVVVRLLRQARGRVEVFRRDPGLAVVVSLPAAHVG